MENKVWQMPKLATAWL